MVGPADLVQFLRHCYLSSFSVSKEWDYHFVGVSQSILPRPTLDPFPVLLKGGRRRTIGLAPFRFQHMWLKEEGFKDLIRD